MLKKLFIVLISLFILAGCKNKPMGSSALLAVMQKDLNVYHGLGTAQNFRVGPGKDSEDVPVYSINMAYASVLFDTDGRIINSYIDVLEVSTPNYESVSMPNFPGWPGVEGYNITDKATAKVTGKSVNTETTVAEYVANWKTKRQRGDAYGMNPSNDWHKQMNAYQEFFKGKTVSEIEEWFKKSTSDRNGRPIDPSTTNEQDREKVNKLSDDEKKMLNDLIVGATMSIRDPHGDIISALKAAYNNRTEVTLSF